MAVGQLVHGCNLVAEGMGGGGLCDADGTACIVGGFHDVDGGFVGVLKDVFPPPLHDVRHCLPRVFLALVIGVDGPPGLYALTQGVEHGALLLIQRQCLQHLRLEDGSVGDDAVVSDALLLAVVVDDGIAGGLTARACRGGDGNEPDACVPVLLLQVERVLRHLAIELDALGNVHAAAAADGEDGVAAFGIEKVNALGNVFVEGIGGEAVEDGIGDGHALDVGLDAQVREGGVADQKDFSCSLEGFIQVADALIYGLSHNACG